MIHVIFEEVWSTPHGTIEGTQIGPRKLLDAKPTRAEAELYAQALASKFHHHNFNGENDYWWGREKDGAEVHRFIVRPATPSSS
jgi:hypothetical protein